MNEMTDQRRNVLRYAVAVTALRVDEALLTQAANGRTFVTLYKKTRARLEIKFR